MDTENSVQTKAADEKFCADCGSAIKIKAEICPKCGVRQINVANNGTAANGKNRILAAILAFCLGGIGIHKFYLGRIGAGIAYALFCWTFIPALLAFIDFIILLVMSDEAFDAKYGQI